MANLKSKNAPPELEQDWHSDPDKPTLHRINKLIGLSEMRQSQQLLQVDDTTETPEPVEMSKVYGYDNQTRKWQVLGNKCNECGKLLREGRITDKHPLICKRTLKINTDEDEILSKVKGFKYAYKKD